ncbi:serine/threonine-protein kinase [Hoyosella subflava]|uniref:Serine/threonine protein kinase PpkA n=1 Tax=Hoyosella subflava (strain DSM 45089 / JCM 17490 / NBRC 109087 / DQS3-9A1) TaxID=443218 RepID=F6ENC0_HOYSD|nr:serine/threonine-protein kinase [Hoyosella subflava]AEF40391.1 Serine/threonine protein kinase PpkA [Hoyosella subflava DQS3-9A1]
MKESRRSRAEAEAGSGGALSWAAQGVTQGLSVPADVARRFALEWESQRQPPELRRFVSASPELRRLSLIELIKVDLHFRWLEFHQPKRLSAYVEEFPELQSAPLPADLIAVEFTVRRQAGENVSLGEYQRRYPGNAVRLGELLGESTQLPDDRTTQQPGTGWLDESATRTAASPPQSDRSISSRTATAPGGAHPTLDDVEAGQQLDDFDLLLSLGSGAFARVFLARQRSMQRLVAVKVSHDHGTEPQTLAQLDHDYIVRVFDQRVLRSHNARLLYMQYVAGGTLQGVLQRVRSTPPDERNGRLLLDAIDDVLAEKAAIRPSESPVRMMISAMSWPEAVAWLGRCLALALDYAAEHGVLHRDVKPANILLTTDGVPKLADFNISFSNEIAGDNPVSYFGGSLAYMSPEQLEACHPGHGRTPADLDTRSDIYSLGVVLWELLTGKRPFGEESLSAETQVALGNMLDLREQGIAPEAEATVPVDCPATLLRVLRVCLASDRDDRWSSGAILAQQFELCLDPHARDLVDPPPRSWRARMERWLFPIAFLAIAAPNALAGLYNTTHNHSLIIGKTDAATEAAFWTAVGLTNGILWPIGAVLLLTFGRRLLVIPRGLRKGKQYDPETLAHVRADTLLLGDRVVMVIFGFWLTAAFSIPIGLEVSGGTLPAGAYLHFLSSLSVHGALAVLYPFFLLNFYLVRCIYPMFLKHGQPTVDDARRLRGLRKRCMIYLPIAALVPLAGVYAVTFLSPEDVQEVITGLSVPAMFIIVAFVVAYWLYRLMEDDLRALERVVASGLRTTEPSHPTERL